MKLRTWLLIGAAAALMLVVSCGVIVGGAAYLIGKRVHIDMHASKRDAEASIARILEGIGEKTPLIASHQDPDVVREELHKRAEGYTGAPPQALHVLVWNPSDEKLVRFHLPFWLLKMKPVGPLDLDAGDFQLRRFRVSAVDLQRAGPLLIIDLHEDNARVLVWTE